MDSYTETFQTWNKIAELYQDKFMHLNLYDHTYNHFCEAVETGRAKILEIGCGPGNIAKYLLSKRPEFEVFGIDIAPNMVELARKNNPSARFAVMDSRRIGEIRELFDGIVCGFCLPYLSQPDSKKLVSDCFNLLNVNGLLYLSFVEGDPANSGFMTGSSGDRCYFYYHNIDMIKAYLTTHDFTEPMVFEVPYQKTASTFETHTILVARKKTDAGMPLLS